MHFDLSESFGLIYEGPCKVRNETETKPNETYLLIAKHKATLR